MLPRMLPRSLLTGWHRRLGVSPVLACWIRAGSPSAPAADPCRGGLEEPKGLRDGGRTRVSCRSCRSCLAPSRAVFAADKCDAQGDQHALRRLAVRPQLEMERVAESVNQVVLLERGGHQRR
jgi:hypothetical protein